MSWRDELRTASFRGVEFKVDGTETRAGRRIVDHEYPFAPLHHFAEDLGQQTGEFRLDGYVLGDEYFTTRDRLLAACRESGAGELVHPYLGTLTVVCAGVRVREAAEEGRMARFAMVFLEAGQLRYPAGARDAEKRLEDAAAALDTAAEESFAETVSTEGRPQWVQDAAANGAGAVETELRGIGLGGPVDTVSGWLRDLEELTDDALAQIARPHEFAQDLQLLVAGLEDAVGSREKALEVYLGLLEMDAPDVAGDSELAAVARANAQAVVGLARQAAAGRAAQAAAAIGWASLDEAVAARVRLVDGIRALEETSADAVYLQLGELAAAVTGAVPPPDATLPRLTTVETAESLPAAVLAYRLYDDPDRGQEIVDRNRVRHPGFVPGGQPLEVLTSG